MRIFRKWRNYRQKPPFGAEIDWSDPITQGLYKVLLLNEFVGKKSACYSSKNTQYIIGPNAYWRGIGVYMSYVADVTSGIKNPDDIGNSILDACALFIKGIEISPYSSFFPVVGGWATAGYDDFKFSVRFANTQEIEFRAKDSSGVATSVRLPKTKINTALMNFSAGIVECFINKTITTTLSASNIDIRGAIFSLGSQATRSSGSAPGIYESALFFNRDLSDDEIMRLQEEPYSFFLVPVPWFMIDLGAGQSYQVVGNIPIGLIPSSVKEVRYYRQGEVPIVITPQAEKHATYRKEGAQQISIVPQAEKQATYRKTGEILMQIGLAAEKQARYFSIGQIPIAVQVAGETKALYRRSGNVPLSLIPDASVAAYYRHEGNIPVALNVQADIACTFKVAGNIGFVLLPQGTWQYVPAAGGIVYTYEGNIPIAIMPQAEKRATYRKTGQVFLNISPNAEMQAIYRPISELVMKLLPEGEVRAEWLIKGEIQLRVMPAGVAVLIRPSEQEDWYFVGVIEEDDIRAVFDEALHGVIWP